MDKFTKFKIGDRVVFKDEGWRGRVVGIGSDGTYVVQFDGVGDHAQGADYFREDQLARNAVFSTNPVVQNALNRCRNEAVATNYNPFFVGDVVTYSDTPGKRFKVRKCGTDWCKINEIDSSGKYVKSEYGLDYDAYVVPVGRIHKINNSALNSAACNAMKFDNPNYRAEDGIQFLNENFDYFDKKIAKAMIDDAKKKGVAIPPSLKKKARAAGIMNSAAVADAGRVKVVCETETLFGTRREEKTMTVAELRAAFAKVGSSRLFNDVMNDFSAGRDANPLLRLPCETWITRP